MTSPFSTAQGENPFAVAVAPLSVFPKMVQLNGLLLLIKPVKLEENLLNTRFSKPGQPPQTYDRLTADVETIDYTPAGFDSNVFPSMYISGSRLITQLRGNLATGKPVLGRLSLYKPNEAAGAGNPWGLLEPTPEDVQLALRYVNGTHEPQAAAAAPQYAVPAGQQVTSNMLPQTPSAQPLHQGSNPFA